MADPTATPIEPEDEVRDPDLLRRELAAFPIPEKVQATIERWVFEEPQIRWWPLGDNRDVKRRYAEFARLAFEAFVYDVFDHEPKSENEGWFRLLDKMISFGCILDSDGTKVSYGFKNGLEFERKTTNELVPYFLAAGLDLRSAVRQRVRMRHTQDAQWLLFRVPSARATLRPAEFLDMEMIRTWDPFAQRTHMGGSDPREASFWFSVRGVGALEDMFEVLDSAPADLVGPLAGSIFQAYVDECRGTRPYRDLEPRSPEALQLLGEWCERLAARLPERDPSIALLWAYLQSVQFLHEMADGVLPDPQRRTASRVAGRALGHLRRAARDQGRACAAVADPLSRDAFSAALGVVAESDGLAAGLREGALLLRVLAEEAVGPDLRWKDVNGMPPPPERWKWLPSTMVAIVHSIGGVEQRTDEELVPARSEFARFLLERLVPREDKERNSDPTEPHPFWRVCCIRALRELSVNPDGRGHRVLSHVSQKDPDGTVRRAAEIALEKMRRAKPKATDDSPRRRLIAATWWLRQAHRTALDLPVDPAGARSTYSREVSFTRERRDARR